MLGTRSMPLRRRRPSAMPLVSAAFPTSCSQPTDNLRNIACATHSSHKLLEWTLAFSPRPTAVRTAGELQVAAGPNSAGHLNECGVEHSASKPVHPAGPLQN